MEWNKLLSEKRIKDLMEFGTARVSEEQGPRSDPRSEFVRDYDRIVFSTPFRRLQDKAQVFPMEPNDAVRTRLTHSIEVSNVARGLAASVVTWMLEQKHVNQDQGRHIESIAAACGLAHDLGNPPFGHAGERAIAEWFSRDLAPCLENIDKPSKQITDTLNSEQQKKDFLKFEGNAQTVRLLTKLQVLSHSYGLNLTCATQSAVLKYVASSDSPDKDPLDHTKSKHGYFASENTLISRIQAEVGSAGYRNPIAFLVESADDIVYSVVDIEDALKKNVIDWHIVREAINRTNDPFAVKILDKAEKYVGDYGNDSRDSLLGQSMRLFGINHCIPAAAQCWIDNYNGIMSGSYRNELYKNSPAEPFMTACKSLAKDYIYSSSDTLKLELLGREVICYLMDTFWQGIKEYNPSETDMPRGFAGNIFSLVSKNYVKVCRAAALDPGGGNINLSYLRMQLLTDYICGMTDTFAVTLYRELRYG
jgi:dGTPase